MWQSYTISEYIRVIQDSVMDDEQTHGIENCLLRDTNYGKTKVQASSEVRLLKKKNTYQKMAPILLLCVPDRSCWFRTFTISVPM